MKKFGYIFAVALMLMSVGSFAGERKLSKESLELLSVVAANAREFEELSQYGNVITSATVEQTSGEFTRFRITTQQCQLRGCLGGATLTIERARDLRPGLFPPYVYNTKIVHLR